MNLIEDAIATLGIPGSIAVVILILFAVLQLIGEYLEAIGKVVPTILKVRKIFIEKKRKSRETEQTLIEVKSLLKEVNGHYDPASIAKRDAWMAWVNARAEVYDDTIIKYKDAIDTLTAALDNNTEMTQKMFVENSRDRIIDFASKVSNPVCYVSREEFNRIFKVYEKYEQFLQEHDMTNGEVELNYQIIQEAYKHFCAEHKFTEEMWLNKK